MLPNCLCTLGLPPSYSHVACVYALYNNDDEEDDDDHAEDNGYQNNNNISIKRW